MPGAGRRGRGRAPGPVVESQEPGEPPLPVDCVPCLAGPVSRPPRPRPINNIRIIIHVKISKFVESAAPRTRRAPSTSMAARPGARAGPGRPGVRAGRPLSRRESSNEAGTGGQPGAGFPINSSRLDRLRRRWSAGASGASRRVVMRAAPVGSRERTAGRDVGGGLHPACQRAWYASRFIMRSPIPAWGRHRCLAI